MPAERNEKPNCRQPSATAEEREVGQEVGSPLHDEWLLDEALAETFPASDPISPTTGDSSDERVSSAKRQA
jgi:hypothetical protein